MVKLHNIKKAHYYYCASALLLTLSANPAMAQLQEQTGSADPGRMSEQLREQLAIPQLSPDISIKQMALVGAPAGAENITLTLGGFDIQGNSIYSDKELSSVYANRVGQKITLSDVYGIANELTMKYRNDGYILTQVVVPPQTIESGIPRLQVVEGFINNVTVQGDGESESELAAVRAYASQITQGDKALNIHSLERHLLLINDLPGVTARSIVSPSETTPGAADLSIIVERDPFDAVITADNFGSRFLGQWSTSGAANFNSLLGLNEVISAQAVYAPGTGYELLHGGLGYEQPVGTMGTRIGALVSVTDTDPGFTLAEFDVRGKANLYSVNVSHPFIRSRNENLNGTLTFDWRDVRSSNNVEVTRKDHVRALRANVQYDFLDMLIGTAVNSVNLKISKGLGIFGSSDEGDANMTRSAADPQFTKAELQVQRLQRLGNSVNLQVNAQGQLASNALPSSEEFGIGGIYSGRGYDPSEIVGDHGVATQVELQWNNPLVQPDGQIIERVQVYSFFDIGRVWNEDATTSDDERMSLASTGVGARVNFTYDLQAGVGVALPLTRRVETEDDREPRFYLNVSKKF